MSAGELAWNAYYDEFGHEPANYNQLQNYAKGNSNLDNLNFKTARDTFNTNKGNGRIDGVEPPIANTLVPPSQEVVPSDTENEEAEYYEDGDYEYYDEEPYEEPQQEPQQEIQPEPEQAQEEEYDYYEEDAGDGYEYYEEEEPAQQEVEQAPPASFIEVDVPVQSSKPKPPPPKAKKVSAPPPSAPALPDTAAAQPAEADEYEDGDYYYEEDPYDEPEAGDGDRRETAAAGIVGVPDTPVTPARVDTSHLTAPAAIMVSGTGKTSSVDYIEDDDKRPCACCPFGYLCVAITALLIAFLAVIIAVLPLVLYYAGDHVPGSATAAIYDAAALYDDSYNPEDIVYRRYHHHTIYHVQEANYDFFWGEPDTEAESWGPDFSMDWLVGSYRGWEYVWGWDFDYNYEDTDDWGNIGGWAQGNDQWRKYPLKDLYVNYGDRLIFKSADRWARNDDCWLVPKEIYDSCDFRVNNRAYANHYIDDNDDVLVNSTFRMFAGGEVYTNLSRPENQGIHFKDYEKWNMFIWNITDNSDMLPCDADDLWCNLVTADTLYFISMYRWDVSWTNGSCKGQFWKGGRDSRGLSTVVHINGYRSNKNLTEADPNGLLDPAVVNDLQYAIGTLGRTVILAQFSDEQRIRSEGHSGLTNVRGSYDGDAAYDDGTYSNGAVASIHDHADNMIVVGIGEIQAVLNGVEFRTRHNDYNLNMPSTTSSDYGATEPIETPNVPPEVLNAGSVTNQIEEMQEWFRAFKTQNKSHRDYTNYFKPILCYLEGTWVLDDDQLSEPFDSDRHTIDAKSWKQLHDKIRWMSNSGRKNSLENLAHLPSAVRNLVNDTFPIVSNWEYRILCHPLKNDVPTSRFRIVDDLSVQLMGSPLTREELVYSRRARFQLSTYINTADPDNDHRWSPGRRRWNYLDYLMEQIPGKDNYMANLTDEMPDGSGGVIHYQYDSALNIGYYNRFYGLMDDDAMGSSKHRRGWADRWLFAAKTSQSKVSPIEFDFEMQDVNGNDVYFPTISRWSYAIPLEIIYQTPLSNWNPYNIEYIERTDYDYSRSGGCETNTAYNGWTTNNAFFTPEEFFNGITTTSSADTANGAVCALDSSNNVRSVMASGHWITFPEIANNVGYVRQRYPIFPISADGYPAYKEIKALEDVTISDDYDDPVLGIEFFGDSRDITYGFMVYLQGGGHQHEMYIPGWKINYYWTDRGDPITYYNGSSYTIEVDSEERNAHSHTVKLWRWRQDENSEWNYEIDTCRFGSLSDTGYTSMDNECADNHNSIVR